jgi:hypothetical protein
VPACITCFSHDKEKHKNLQLNADEHFKEIMGRGGENTHREGHTTLHTWINEKTQDADIHTHDHWVIKDEDKDKHRDIMCKFLQILIDINFVNKSDADQAKEKFCQWFDKPDEQ